MKQEESLSDKIEEDDRFMFVKIYYIKEAVRKLKGDLRNMSLDDKLHGLDIKKIDEEFGEKLIWNKKKV